jgi:hypothetical protein
VPRGRSHNSNRLPLGWHIRGASLIESVLRSRSLPAGLLDQSFTAGPGRRNIDIQPASVSGLT